MGDDLISKNLNNACVAWPPSGPVCIGMNEEIEILQEYFGRKFNGLNIDDDLENKIKGINYIAEQDFDYWYKKRVCFYNDNWQKEMRGQNQEIINRYDFLSETFKVLDKCSWWVQNAYQQSSGTKSLLNNLDCIAARFEKEGDNKDILVKKANNFCNNKGDIDFRGKSIKVCDKNQNEKERQIFAFFTELKVAEELSNGGFKDIRFILEQQSTKTPDLSAKKDDVIYYVEVKRMQNPREEDEDLRSDAQHSGDVNPNFYEPLKKKIGDFICNTKKKFKGIENGNVKIDKEQKILVIDFEPGIDARLNDNFSNSTLNSIFGIDYSSDLEKTHDIKIWTRKYF